MDEHLYLMILDLIKEIHLARIYVDEESKWVRWPNGIMWMENEDEL